MPEEGRDRQHTRVLNGKKPLPPSSISFQTKLNTLSVMLKYREVELNSPVRKNCTLGCVRGAAGNRCIYSIRKVNKWLG